LAVASSRSSSSRQPARFSAFAPGLALVLDVAGSPTFTPGCLLLHSIATFALAIAILAPLSLALAVAVLAPWRQTKKRGWHLCIVPVGLPPTKLDDWRHNACH
jgi:hypothetical protein